MARKTWPAAERYPRLRRLMEAVKTEFLETTEEGWPAAVHDFVKSQGLATLLYGPDTPAGRRLAQAWPSGEGPRLVAYDRPVEQMKERLFHEMDAGFTTTRGGIAETGGLIVWPSPEEPRLMSLVPPVHLALLDRRRDLRHLLGGDAVAGVGRGNARQRAADLRSEQDRRYRADARLRGSRPKAARRGRCRAGEDPSRLTALGMTARARRAVT